jgi:hypothetical protein
MEIEFRDIDKILLFSRVISNKKKYSILIQLKNDDLTLSEIFSKMDGEIKYKDNLYRYIENMVKLGIVKKTYNLDTKKITYKLLYNKISIIIN